MDTPIEYSLPKKLVLFIVGGATQMSFFISFFTVDYFNFFFPEYSVEFYLSIFVSALSFIGAILTVIRPFEKFYRFPMVACFFSSCVLSCTVSLLVYASMKQILSKLISFILVVTSLSLLGFFESVNSGCVFSFLGKHYGAKAVQLAQSGTTWVALSIYILRVILKASVHPDLNGFALSGYLEFGLIAGWMFLCVLLANWLTRQGIDPKPQFILNESENERLIDNPSSSRGSLVGPVIRRQWNVILAMLLGLLLNQSFYPGIFSVLHGVSSDWSITIVFGMFAVGDTIGQTLPSCLRIYKRAWVWAFPCVQFLMLPLIVMAIQHKVALEIFQSYPYTYILAFLWGFNVGSGVCCHMIMIVEDEKEKALGSTIAIVTLQLGLIVASVAGYIVQYFVQIG